MTPPLLSIVTPCLNRAALIAQAIESAREQDYPHTEHIVTDGGSTDGTLAVLRRYPHLRVTSERDRGLYDALNKAIRSARGEIIGQLNSDDLYEPAVFGAVMQAFADHPEADAVVGGALAFEEGAAGPVVRHRYQPIATEGFLRRATLGATTINAWFFRRRVYDRIGWFSPDYAIAADRDFLLRFCLAGCVFLPLDLPVYRYRYHGGSLTINDQHSLGTVKALDEHLLMAQRLRDDTEDLLVRSAARLWHRATALEKVIVLARNGRLGRAGAAAARQAAEDPAWLLYAPRALCGKAISRVMRRRPSCP